MKLFHTTAILNNFSKVDISYLMSFLKLNNVFVNTNAIKLNCQLAIKYLKPYLVFFFQKKFSYVSSSQSFFLQCYIGFINSFY